MYKIISTLSFICLSIFFYQCGNIKVVKNLPPDNIEFGEQNVVDYKPENSYVGGGYITPAYELGVELKKVKANYFAVKSYVAKNNCNQDYIFVVDMRIPCYKKRFFIYDARKDSLIATALVAHGIGSETFKGNLVFSNVPNSKCSSLGKYKISESYTGMWGFSYRLKGLDSTNNKALERAVVLHSYPTIPDEEIGGNPIVFSYGCPMVSPKFLERLKGIISKAKKPIILSIIY
jgi:L,D-transpeptidase catalytic domain